MTEAGKVTVPVQLDDKGAEAQADSFLESIAGKFSRFEGALKFAGLGLGIAEIGKQIFDVGEEFAAAEHTIQRQTGLTGRALDHLVEQSQHVATTVPASFQDSATAISDLRQRLGLTGRTLVQTTDQVLALSKVTGGDLTTTIDESATALERWSIPAGQMQDKLDLLFRASQKTGVSFDDIATRTGQAATVMQDLGFSFDQTAIIIARLEQTGTNTSQVLAGLRAGLAKTAKAGKDPQLAFERLAVKIENAGSEADATRLAVDRFGSRAGPELAKAIRSGTFATDALFKSIKDGQGTIRDTEEQTRSFGDEWTIFSNKVKLAVEPLATQVLVGLEQGLQFVSDNFGAVIQAGQAFVGFMQGVPGKIALIGGAAAGGAEAITLLSDAFNGAIEAVAKFRAINFVELIAANPIVAAGAAIAAVGAAVILFRDRTNLMADAEDAARRSTQQLGDALNHLHDDALGVKQAQLQTQQSAIDLKDAQDSARKVLDKYGQSSDQYVRAQLRVKQAEVDLGLARDRLHSSTQQQVTDQRRLSAAARDTIAKIVGEGTAAVRTANLERGRFSGFVTQSEKSRRAAEIFTQAMERQARENSNLAAKTQATNSGLATAERRTTALSIAAIELTRRLGRVPTRHEINVFYRQNMDRLIQQARDLANGIRDLPLSKTIRLQIDEVINQHPGFRQALNQVAPGTPVPHQHGAVITRPEIALLGETSAARPEIVTPEALMRRIVREEGGGGATEVRVFIGDQELTSIVRSEVVHHDQRSAAQLAAGSRFARAS